MLARLRARARSETSEKIEVEDDDRLVDPVRDDEVGVHAVTVTVDHEVRVNPVVVRTVAAPDGASPGVRALADDRARLQTGMLAELDRIPAVLENAVEALVQMRHVVAAIQIVVDEDLPVAVERVLPLLRPDQLVETRWRDAAREIGAEESLERRAAAVDPDEHPLLPQTDLERNQTVRRPVEVAHAGEVGRPCQLALERVRPSVIRAAQDLRGPLGVVTTAAAWCRQTLKKPRRTASLPRTTTTGSPDASSQARYWPGARTWSARPATCHERANTVRRSRSMTSGDQYQAAGIVDARSSGASAS